MVSSSAPSNDADDDRERLESLARAHLPADVAERWLSLLRPAVRLAAAEHDAPAVARLGGLPSVPADFEWPRWEGHGSLPFVAEVDLAALARTDLDAGIALPSTGRLLAFYYDGPAMLDEDGLVLGTDAASQVGARLLHVGADGSDLMTATAPDGVIALPELALTARQALTYPHWEHPALVAAFGAGGLTPDEWATHPINDDDFIEALGEVLGDEIAHQVGGWADPVQVPVEHEVAEGVLGGERLDWDHPAHLAETARWTLVLQMASVSGGPDDVALDHLDGRWDALQWGDMGALYWLARRDDLPALTDTWFTWQT